MYNKNDKTLADVGSERAVLSGICQHGREAYYDVSDIVTVNTFTQEINQILYKCLEEVLKESTSPDVATLITTAQSLGYYDYIIKDKSNLEYIRSVFNFPILLANVRNHARKIVKLEYARLAQNKHKIAYDLLGEVRGTESIDSILSISENVIFDLVSEINKGRDTGPELITKDSDEIIEHLMKNPSDFVGIPTPWPNYNAAIGGGLRRGGVNLIGARPKIGKTTLAKEAALHFALNLNYPVLMLDTEMVRNDQLFRSLSSISKVSLSKIETGKFSHSAYEINKVLQANEILKKSSKFFHEKVAGKPFEEILAIIRRWILKNVGYDDNGNVNDCVVMYDYFKLMDDTQLDKMQEYQAMGFQISRLSDFCKEFDFPCLSFVQLNRDGASKDTSEVISQSDRLLWLCHSFSIFRQKMPEEIAEDGINNGNRRLKVMDTRFGPGMDDNDYINMHMDGDISTVKELGRKKDLKKQQELTQQGFATINSDEYVAKETELMI